MPARLHLARWEDSNGSSSGWWLVRELAGVALRRSHTGAWKIDVGVQLSEKSSYSLYRLWGPDYPLEIGRRLRQRHYELLNQRFATRGEALEALALAVELDQQQNQDNLGALL